MHRASSSTPVSLLNTNFKRRAACAQSMLYMIRTYIHTHTYIYICRYMYAPTYTDRNMLYMFFGFDALPWIGAAISCSHIPNMVLVSHTLSIILVGT